MDHTSVDHFKFYEIVRKYSDETKTDNGIWHTIYYNSVGEYVAQHQDNVLDDGPDFYWINNKYL